MNNIGRFETLIVSASPKFEKVVSSKLELNKKLGSISVPRPTVG